MEERRDEAVDERAAELQVETTDEDLKDPEVARDAADQILKESRRRTEQAEDLDPDDDDVVRRSSEETATEPE
ncbi:MAG: hypothetical protein GEU68_01180 [Actinobacteria bacterium]|nr:hypothetical protein [Actinomycetota bacterium]